MSTSVALDAVVEAGFKRHMAELTLDEQRKCLKAVEWFERTSRDHRQRSDPVEGTPRRRLRSIRASNYLRLVFSVADDARVWLWAGRYRDMANVVKKLEAAEIEKTESINVNGVLSWLKDAPDPRRVEAAAVAAAKDPEPEQPSGPQLPKIEVDKLSESVTSMSMFVADARVTCTSLATKIAAIMEQRSQAEVHEIKPAHPRAKPITLAEFNEIRAERDRFRKLFEVEKERVSSLKHNKHHDAERQESEILKKLKKENESLRNEVTSAKAALKVAHQRSVSAAVTHEAKEELKDACAKVVDNKAAIFAKTGIPSLEEHADGLRRLGQEIRALKL